MILRAWGPRRGRECAGHARGLRERRLGGLWLAAITLGVLLAAGPRAGADAESSREYQVKAAFIFNFVQFVEWPAAAFADDKAPIIVAIVGQDYFKGALDQAIKDKTVGGRPLVLKRFPTVADMRDSHVLFVSPSENDRLPEIRAKLAAANTLTIGETDGFTTAGGIIRLFKEENKVRFEINVKAAERARLKISAKLLKLARIYEE